MEKAKKEEEEEEEKKAQLCITCLTQQGFTDWLRVIGNVSLKRGLA